MCTCTCTCTQACFLCFFSNPYISPFNSRNFSFTSLHSFYLFPTTFMFILSWVWKLYTVELHFLISCMSRKATQCVKQRCSTNLHNLAKPGPLWTWLHGLYTLSTCKLPHTCTKLAWSTGAIFFSRLCWHPLGLGTHSIDVHTCTSSQITFR